MSRLVHGKTLSVVCYSQIMSVITIPKVLRDKLGDKGVDSFAKIINESETTSRNDLATKEDIFRFSEHMIKI
ncbi:MAG: hypothetical protein H7843_08995 [Nitrospirota bacterium]